MDQLPSAWILERPGNVRQLAVVLVAMDNWWMNAVWSLTPTVLIGLFFWMVMRLILRADRTERRIYREIEDQERAKAGLPLRDE